MSVLRRLSLAVCLVAIATPVTAQRRTSPQSQPLAPAFDTSLFNALEWREIGPFRGGRVTAVAGHADQPLTYYFGGTGGGVFKTTDGGLTWTPISDKDFKVGSIGAIEVAPSDPNVIYVGTGESPIRGNVSPGNGVYKSTDAGKTWSHVGLANAGQIGAIRVHPTNADLVYVAVLGHAFGPNPERGVFRSQDGGKTWDKVLFRSDSAGAVDLAMDPANPRILYTSIWQARRGPWYMSSGGSGSGLFKSTDGGDTWKELTRNDGMPTGVIGKIGVTVSANHDRVWAIVEADSGGVFRSEDGGETWRRTNDERNLRQRAWYYSHIHADPKNPETVYVLNTSMYRSVDGGRTFTQVRAPHGDHHGLWIAPNDPARMINSNDGGANVSYNGGATWSGQDNQPTAQFYHVIATSHVPYRICGSQQDNSTGCIASRTDGGTIGEKDWYEVGGGESGWIAARADDPDIVYAGSYSYLSRLDVRTGQERNIFPWPDNPMGWGAGDLKYRFQWTFPLVLSPFNPNVLYAGANVVFRTTNEGQSWEAISSDLTRNDKSKQGPSGGPITKDNTSVEYYNTIFYGAESPVEAGVLWVGSDDGLVHVSRDGGAHWDNVTPPKTIMPEWIMINEIDASPTDKGAAYVAATNFKWDDFHPFLYKTADYGKTWTKIVDGIPATEFTRVIRADPKKRGLLYAGTERGVWVSYDDGGHWQPLQYKLPIVPIHDLLVHDDALIAATHGRAFWMLDDLEPLRQLTPDVAAKPVHVFTPALTWRTAGGGGRPGGGLQGTNPPNGAIIDYYIHDQKPGTKVAMAIVGSDGKVIREYTGTVQAEAAKPREASGTAAATVTTPATDEAPKEAIKSEGGEAEEEGGGDEGGRRGRDSNKLTEVVNGHNRFVWNLRTAEVKRFPGLIMWSGGTLGPRVVPGTYQARLSVGDQPPVTTSFEIRQDPRSTSTAADLKAQFDFVTSVHDKLSEVNEAVSRIRDVRKQLTDAKKRVADNKAVVAAANDLDKKMTTVEEALYQTKNKSSQDPLNYPIRLNDKLAGVGDSAASGPYAPTAQQIAVRDELVSQINVQLAKLKAIWDTDLPAFNKLAAGVPVVK